MLVGEFDREEGTEDIVYDVSRMTTSRSWILDGGGSICRVELDNVRDTLTISRPETVPQLEELGFIRCDDTNLACQIAIAVFVAEAIVHLHGDIQLPGVDQRLSLVTSCLDTLDIKEALFGITDKNTPVATILEGDQGAQLYTLSSFVDNDRFKLDIQVSEHFVAATTQSGAQNLGVVQDFLLDLSAAYFHLSSYRIAAALVSIDLLTDVHLPSF
ncbi:hypothetical protein HG531_005176 [Fusarium graminearum]|nr:hypothetical protein HG531_005176 [Fusarium graminearum]